MTAKSFRIKRADKGSDWNDIPIGAFIAPEIGISPADIAANVPASMAPEPFTMSLETLDLDQQQPRALDAAENALLRRIDLTTLRLFIAVCEEKNLTRAAAREGIAASAVSKRMNDFELAFGISLFERLSKGMALTPAGEALLHHARVTLLNVEKIAVELAEYAKGVRGHVRMFANLSAIVQFLPEDLSGFFGAHRSLRVDLQERPSAQVVKIGRASCRERVWR